MNIDIHVHTTTSSCSIFRPDRLVELALDRRLPVVVTTNHHDAHGDDPLRDVFASQGVLFIEGLEMTNEWGDFLVFGEGIDQFSHYSKNFPVQALPNPGIAVIWAHPYRFMPPEKIDAIKHQVAPYIDAVEVVNGNCILSCPQANTLALGLAGELNKSKTAGSDSHADSMFFMTWTEFLEPVKTQADFVRCIKTGAVKIP